MIRGKKRAVVEHLAQEHLDRGDRGHAYVWTVRLACGHTTKSSAQRACRKDQRPTMGYCLACAAADVEAR